MHMLMSLYVLFVSVSLVRYLPLFSTRGSMSKPYELSEYCGLYDWSHGHPVSILSQDYPALLLPVSSVCLLSVLSLCPVAHCIETQRKDSRRSH